MHLVEWMYETGPLRSKLCDTVDALRFWVDLAKSNGASVIVVTQVGAC